MNSPTLRSGDFTGLAADYSSGRPDYAKSVLDALLALIPKSICDIDLVDLGAGTGIWTRMVHSKGVRSVVAIEPNFDMRARGERDSAGLQIRWLPGRAENTGLPDAACDWVTMASSLHWADFDATLLEVRRVLRPGGRFTALWNPRLIEASPLLMEIEQHIHQLRPDIKRVSSGRSGVTTDLSDRLWASPGFDDVVYVEGRHVVEMTSQRYLAAWRSVNDLRVQMGHEGFEAFLAFVERRVAGEEIMAAHYVTRAWSARCRGC